MQGRERAPSPERAVPAAEAKLAGISVFEITMTVRDTVLDVSSVRSCLDAGAALHRQPRLQRPTLAAGAIALSVGSELIDSRR